MGKATCHFQAGLASGCRGHNSLLTSRSLLIPDKVKGEYSKGSSEVIRLDLHFL